MLVWRSTSLSLSAVFIPKVHRDQATGRERYHDAFEGRNPGQWRFWNGLGIKSPQYWTTDDWQKMEQVLDELALRRRGRSDGGFGDFWGLGGVGGFGGGGGDRGEVGQEVGQEDGNQALPRGAQGVLDRGVGEESAAVWAGGDAGFGGPNFGDTPPLGGPNIASPGLASPRVGRQPPSGSKNQESADDWFFMDEYRPFTFRDLRNMVEGTLGQRNADRFRDGLVKIVIDALQGRAGANGAMGGIGAKWWGNAGYGALGAGGVPGMQTGLGSGLPYGTPTLGSGLPYGTPTLGSGILGGGMYGTMPGLPQGLSQGGMNNNVFGNYGADDFGEGWVEAGGEFGRQEEDAGVELDSAGRGCEK
ncbi:hypothetical protein H2203_006279 [Taxawa tesnikishii (nom. ined.)]|nr:hypothetical protein H2203_006279 [Dothideales sp. JES 119]